MLEHVHINLNEVMQLHKNDHKDYEYYKRVLRKKGAGDCAVSQYEIPPGKSAYPYHYHLANEESFYILSGRGVITTPEGKRDVSAGDFLFFPADESGAHKLTNTSKDEKLVYLDFDVTSKLDVCIYPDSDKIGVWGKDVDKVFRSDHEVEYYEGE